SSILPVQTQHGDNQSAMKFGIVVFGWLHRQHRVLPMIIPQANSLCFTVVTVLMARLVGFCGGFQQDSEIRVFDCRSLSKVCWVSNDLGLSGRQFCSPSIPAAVTTVDGGYICRSSLTRGGFFSLFYRIVAPAKCQRRVDFCINATEFTNPQVSFYGERLAPAFNSDV